MKSVVVFCLVLVGACGEKRNPDRCCVDETDCAQIGLPPGSTCPDGQLCRGNECIELTCTTSSECDLTAPYCEDSTCTDACSTDASCPGAGQPAWPFCLSGVCVECRDGMDDCPGNQVCSGNKCGACATDDECPTGLCLRNDGGVCASPDQVAFVTPTGAMTASCTKQDPCSLFRALTINPERLYIKLAAGMYENDSTLTLQGKRLISGAGAEVTAITNTTAGPVFEIGGGGDVTLENLRIFGATSGAAPGIGVRCAGPYKLALANTVVTQNASDGIDSICELAVTSSTLSDNGGFGARVQGFEMAASYRIERSLVTGNTMGGIKAVGNGALRNLFVVRNSNLGVQIKSETESLASIEFTTIADNTGTGLDCPGAFGPQTAVTNLLVYRNPIMNPLIDVNERNCTFQACLASPNASNGCSSINQNEFFAFVSPDAPPYDYHVNALNSANVDRGTGGNGTIDFDGDARPKGAAADVGADEAF